MKTKFLPLIVAALFLATPIVQATGKPPVNTFSGRAFVVQAKVPGLLSTTIADTGKLENNFPRGAGVLEEITSIKTWTSWGCSVSVLRSYMLRPQGEGRWLSLRPR